MFFSWKDVHQGRFQTLIFHQNRAGKGFGIFRLSLLNQSHRIQKQQYSFQNFDIDQDSPLQYLHRKPAFSTQ